MDARQRLSMLAAHFDSNQFWSSPWSQNIHADEPSWMESDYGNALYLEYLCDCRLGPSSKSSAGFTKGSIEILSDELRRKSPG